MARTLSNYHHLREVEETSWRQQELDKAVRAQGAEVLGGIDTAILLSAESYTPVEYDLVRVEASPLDASQTDLCRLYLAQTPEARAYIRSSISRDHGWTLITFSRRAAVMGERARSEDWIRCALAAHSIEDLAAGDVRDNLVAITLVHHCAGRIAMQTEELFREVAAVSGPPIAAVLLDYLERSPADRSIQVMGYREVATDSDTGYMRG